MKKWLIFIWSIFLLFSLSACNDTPDPIDEINEYSIYIKPTEEGNLKLQYKIEWHVLNSDKEGPLEWVKIGIPNRYIQSLHGISQAIRQISYNSEDGDYVRIDLDRAYYADEVVLMEFSFIQTHIYTLKKNEVQYQFIPGWFNEIRVKQISVFWPKKNIIYENSMESDSEYYIWKASLDFGESIEVNVKYDQSSFINLSKSNTYPKDNTAFIILVAALIFVGIMIFIICIQRFTNDGYYSYRGFSGKSYYMRRWWPYHYFSHGVSNTGEKLSDPRIVNKGSSHHGGSSCACACACACAGGGRAGCSRKDFYYSETEIDKILDRLNQEGKEK